MKITLVLLSILGLMSACSPSKTNSDGSAVIKEIPLPINGGFKTTCFITGTSSYQNTVTISDTTFVYKSVAFDNTTCNGNILTTVFYAQNAASYTVVYQNVNTYLVRILNPDLSVVYKLFKRNNMGIAIDVISDQSLSALQARRDNTFPTAAINTFLEL